MYTYIQYMHGMLEQDAESFGPLTVQLTGEGQTADSRAAQRRTGVLYQLQDTTISCSVICVQFR